MENIKRDPRHHGIKIIREGETDDRAFASWNLAYLSPSAEEVSKCTELEGRHHDPECPPFFGARARSASGHSAEYPEGNCGAMNTVRGTVYAQRFASFCCD